jgi:hypothetical protein
MKITKVLAGCVSDDHVSTGIDNNDGHNAALFIKFQCLFIIIGSNHIFKPPGLIKGFRI